MTLENGSYLQYNYDAKIISNFPTHKHISYFSFGFVFIIPEEEEEEKENLW